MLLEEDVLFTLDLDISDPDAGDTFTVSVVQADGIDGSGNPINYRSISGLFCDNKGKDIIFRTELSFSFSYSHSPRLDSFTIFSGNSNYYRISIILCGTAAASNKHTAIIAATNLIAQITLAILLVQLLDQSWKQQF